MPEPVTMQCMEVWGGSELVQNKVSLSGLDCWVFSKPYQSAEAGGDVYYVSSCATGRITRLLIADVSGHGDGVRDTATRLRTLMRRYVNHHDQGSFVRSMNHHFTQMSVGGSFATAIVMTYFGPHRSLSISNAGHPPPFWYRASANQWQSLERIHEQPNRRPASDIANLPLGVQDSVDYDQTRLTLDVGDMVICFSDSLTEARTADGNFLGQAGLLAIMRTLNPREPDKLIESLVNAILALSPAALDEDDVTIMLFQPSGSQSMTASQKFLSPLRVLRGIVRSFLPGGGPMPIPQFSLLNLGGAFFDRFHKKPR